MTLALSATSLLGLCQAMRCLGSTPACSHAHDISPALEDQLVLELEAWRAIVEPDGVLLDPMEGAQQLASRNGEAGRPGVHPGLIPVNQGRMPPLDALAVGQRPALARHWRRW